MTAPEVVRITLNGKHAMTRPQLAAALGLDPAAGDTTVRHALRRAGRTPDGHLDGRTPLYLAAPTLKRLRDRPGRWPTDA
jgi:hypothetical protein